MKLNAIGTGYVGLPLVAALGAKFRATGQDFSREMIVAWRGGGWPPIQARPATTARYTDSIPRVIASTVNSLFARV